jgi:hypothetical protein
MAVGMQDSAVYSLKEFNALKRLRDAFSKMDGVVEVISIHNLPILQKDTAQQRFVVEKIFKEEPKSQQELDSLMAVFNNIKLYDRQFMNNQNGAMLMLLSISDDYLNSKKRLELVENIMRAGKAFSEETKIELHYAGLPYLRSILAGKVKAELEMFLIFSAIVTALIMFFFFRSFAPVFFSLVLIGIVILWTMGFLVLLDFRITLLTGLLPPILVVIGIPNCIYLLTKYHQEFAAHRDKHNALRNVVKKIGAVTLLTNATTAIGFAVLLSTKIEIMREFGTVATLSILSTFILSLTLIPSVFSYLPDPKARHIKHLDFKPMLGMLNWLAWVVDKRRSVVYGITIVVVTAGLIGASKIRPLTFMVDDLPQNSDIMLDLKFFERNFIGVMPLEIVVDMGQDKGITPKHLKVVDEIEDYLDSLPNVTRPISMLAFVKAANQAFFEQEPSRYRLPNSRERAFVFSYLKGEATDSVGLMRSFVDSTQRQIRLSMKVADIGSIRLDSLVKQDIQPRIAKILEGSVLTAKLTGTTLLYIKGNDYLINNLQGSMLIAFFLIAAIMGTLFGKIRMVIISLIPNMIPLIVTAGMMGFLGVPLKPSTALVFSIAFGISVDDSIHFLAKYRQELIHHNFDVVKSINVSLKETGMSMIYTSLVLFCGFVTFTASEFGGTKALGILTSTTLLIAMITNLVLLPCLLRTFDVNKHEASMLPIFEKYDGFYDESDDEEIDLSKLGLKKDNPE